MRSRLARARDKLRRGLTRRGVVVPAAVLAIGTSPRSASASVSTHLCDITTRAAIQFAAGQAAVPVAASLAQEVLQAMFATKLRLIATTLVLMAIIATGAGYLAHALAMKDEPKPQSVVAKLDDTTQRPPPGRMFVVGRVLDPQGKPVPGAKVMVHTRLKQLGNAVGIEGLSPVVTGHADADGSGRFRLDAPRTSSSRNDEFMAVALAPGYGVGWTELDTDADQPSAEIKLQPRASDPGAPLRSARAARPGRYRVGLQDRTQLPS